MLGDYRLGQSHVRRRSYLYILALTLDERYLSSHSLHYRGIVILEKKLEIQCVIDITEIKFQEIARIRRVSPRRMRWTIPLFGSAGFCGYYGKFFDLQEFEVVTIYASEWNNFVEITDIYDSRTYVSCREAKELMAAIKERQASQ